MAEKNYEEPSQGYCQGTQQNGVIICPTCRHRIERLTNMRCPRCNASLIKMGCDGNCKKCGA